MNRRKFLGAALGAAATVAVVRFAIDPALAAPGGTPGSPTGPGDMTHREPNGEWTTHLLPFAAPFPSEAAVKAEIEKGRKLGLFK